MLRKQLEFFVIFVMGNSLEAERDVGLSLFVASALVDDLVPQLSHINFGFRRDFANPEETLSGATQIQPGHCSCAKSFQSVRARFLR